MLRTLCRVACAVAISLPIAAFPARADDGPPRPIRADDRPARTTLRPTELPDLAPLAAPRRSDKEVVIVIGTFCVLPALLVVFLGPPLLSLLG